MAAVALLVAGVAGAGQEAVRVAGEWRCWRSGHFVAYSDASDRTVSRALRDLEALRGVLERTSAFELRSPVPTFVYLFRDRRGFEPYALPHLGRPDTISGYFARREDASFMAIDGSRHSDASGTVYHEYVHDLLATNLPGCPLWLEEGLAELYQSFRISGGVARIGLPVDQHLVTLQVEGLLPLATLIAVHRDHPVYVEGPLRSRFYAQSWALVHYLLLGAPERRGQLDRYVALVRAGEPDPDAFDGTFGTDRQTLESELRRYVQRAIFSFRKGPVPSEPERHLSSRTMAPAEVLTVLGDLLAVQSPPNPAAAGHYRAALESDPTWGAAAAGLADLAALAADWPTAAARYRQAAALAPTDPHVQYRAGAYLLERGNAPAEALVYLTAAVDLAADLGPAWAHLAGARELGAGDLPGALAAARRAAELMPSDREVLIQLVRLAAAAGDPALAERAARTSRLADPDDRRRLRVTLVVGLANAATTALVDGRPDDAAALLGAARRNLGPEPDPSLRELLDRVAATLAATELAARYLEAENLARAGQRDAAQALLATILAQNPPAELRSTCDRLQAQLLAPPVSPTPSGATMITRVSAGEIDAVNHAIAAGDLDLAIALLEELDRRVDRAEDSWIDAKLIELRRARQRNRFGVKYNLAVDLFNQRRYREAVEVLDGLLGTALDPADAAAANRLRERARSAAGSEPPGRP